MNFENDRLMDALKMLVGATLSPIARTRGDLDEIFKLSDNAVDLLGVLAGNYAPFAQEVGIDFCTILGEALMVVRDRPDLFRQRVLEAKKRLVAYRS